jgi:hypothetical protein
VDIGLAETVRSLRRELVTAMEDGEGASVRLRVQSVKLEIQVAVTASGESNGDVKFWVLSAGGKAAESTSFTHTLSLELAAETNQGGTVHISSDAGTALPD